VRHGAGCAVLVVEGTAGMVESRDEPSVELLLDVDAEYRQKAAARLLPRITPRRFNRTREAWLPVLHTRRGPWRVTALYSNTERAHRLRRTHDWVVLYFHRDGADEGRRTVVTETRGVLEGRRVVRGRESELVAGLERSVVAA
jgi:putative hydrolase